VDGTVAVGEGTAEMTVDGGTATDAAEAYGAVALDRPHRGMLGMFFPHVSV